MARRYPGQCFVFGVAPVIAVVVQFSLALYHGFTLVLPATFALVVAIAVPATMRHQLAQFHREHLYRTAGLDHN